MTSLPAAERGLDRAIGPGRLRGIGLDLDARALASPRAAGGVLRRGLRDARALHSWERRLVADLVYDLIRREALLDRSSGSADPLARWLGLLVHRGADAAAARDAWVAERGAPAPTFEVDLERCLAGLAVDEALAARASVPLAAARALRRAFGDDAERFVAASNTRAPLTLRIGRGRRDEAVERLRAAGLDAHPGASPDAARLPPGVDVVAALRGLVWEPQDEASQRVAALVAPARGELVVDLCAGAGGKSLAIADRHPHARVRAWDVRPAALRELERRAREAGVRVVIGPPPAAADWVLVDAPCSGSGTWRRHPELRWRLDALRETLATQAELLDAGAAIVRPGGALVYATCSVLREEDEDQIDRFLDAHPDFAPEGPALRTAPHLDDTDGFFARVLRRGGA